MSEQWSGRQSKAALGFVPILLVLVGGGGVGAALAETAGAPGWLGFLVGAVLGYFASRYILRRLFAAMDGPAR